MNQDGILQGLSYDDLGRRAESHEDAEGLDAATTLAYDSNDRKLTSTSPISVPTTSEHDDFGQTVLDRSKSRGDHRYEFNAAGRMVKQRISDYNADTHAQYACRNYDWLGRMTEYDVFCNAAIDWTFQYDGASIPSGVCPSGSSQMGQLSTFYRSSFKRVLCYHPNGLLYSVFQRNNTSTWSHSASKGTRRIYDTNLNLVKEYVHDRPDTHSYAVEIEYSYDASLNDRLKSIRARPTAAGSWTQITSASTDPTYFAFGGLKTLNYSNGIVETNSYDTVRALTRRKTDAGASVYTDVELSHDDLGNITTYDDADGLRHLKYYAAYDGLQRLRCVSRDTISSCTGSEPWADKFIESFDYDLSGNRANRRFGAYNSSDDDDYDYVSGPTDIIDKVISGGTTYQQGNTPNGVMGTLNYPTHMQFGFDQDEHLTSSADEDLPTALHSYTRFWDRYKKVGTCNSRETHFYYTPSGPGGTSHELKLQDRWNTCSNEYDRHVQAFIYVEGRPLAALNFDKSGESSSLSNFTPYWIHTDQIGTPILVTDSSGVEAWRWENDPFGRTPPVEYRVYPSDVDPDDTTGNPYNTCCCSGGGCGAGCNLCTSGCTSTQCTGGGAQDVVKTLTYSPTNANNVRVHFSTFDVAPGTSSRTGKDYVRLYKANGTTVVDTLTGNLGPLWSAWSGDTSIVVKLIADNAADGTAGFVIDQIEYTKGTDTRYVMDLRMPGQIWDSDARASYNFHRWYRSEDGRYLSPDPIGLDGGEAGYFSYTGGNPLNGSDQDGLATGMLVPLFNGDGRTRASTEFYDGPFSDELQPHFGTAGGRGTIEWCGKIESGSFGGRWILAGSETYDRYCANTSEALTNRQDACLSMTSQIDRYDRYIYSQCESDDRNISTSPFEDLVRIPGRIGLYAPLHYSLKCYYCFSCPTPGPGGGVPVTCYGR